MSIEAMKQALQALENNRQTHHYCEDTWYSCPKHEGGCANDAEGNECNCGADKANVEIDAAIIALRQAIAEAEKQEPDELTIAYMSGLYDGKKKREWVGLTDEDLSVCDEDGIQLAEYWEAKLREKNGC